MIEPKSSSELQSRFQRAKYAHSKRDSLLKLVREVYEMRKTRKSDFLGGSEWRSLVPAMYWQASARGHNVVDIMTAILAGNAPQYQCTIPGNAVSTVGSRAEKFLTGVWRINSRRQMIDLMRETVFRTVLDGGVGIRVYWNPVQYGAVPEPTPVPSPDSEGESWLVQSYATQNFPIIIDLVPLDNLYTLGRGTLGRPFDQVFHVTTKTANEVIYEWDGEEGTDLTFLNEMTEGDKDKVEDEYVEWWGQKPDGKVWQAIMFKQKFVVEPRETNYPVLPYVITAFKTYDRKDPNWHRIPFLFPILPASEKEEYITSRIIRMVDLYSNLPPVHRGNSPINLEGTWGKVTNLQPDERLEFPTWPGNPPDIYRLQEDLRNQQSEGSVSEAAFGQASARMSGYGLSQLIGSDNIRTDTPRTNLELAFAAVAEIVFALMRVFSPDIHLAVTVRVQSYRMAAMLSGNETDLLIVDTFVQAKQMSDQVRLAALGAQLASLPNAPVSNAYILEHYFQIPQPEDEMDRKMAEEVIKDPTIRLMSLLKVLQDSGSPFAVLIEQQLGQAIQAAMQPAGTPASAPDNGEMAGLGLGLPQNLSGNMPIIPPGGNPSQESGFDRTALLMGGPPPQF